LLGADCYPRRVVETEVISVRSLRWEAKDRRYMVGEFDALGQPTSRPVPWEQGEQIRFQLAKAQPDIDRYARMPDGFPAPTTIPVEITR
jgi:hypothetical protein